MSLYGMKKDPVTGKITMDKSKKAPTQAKGTGQAYLDYEYKSGKLKGEALENYVAKARAKDKVMSDSYVRSLTDIMGDKTSVDLQGVVKGMIGEGPEDIKGMYEESGVLELAEEATKGYTAQEKEAITSEKRQELAMAARAGGGTRGRLRGQSSEYATAQAQFGSGLAQAQAVGEIETEEQARKDKAEKELADLRLAIAQTQKDEEDSYQKMLSDISMNLANTLSITKG